MTPTENKEENKDPKKKSLREKYPKVSETIVKTFAVLGLIIIILIAFYGAYAFLRSIPNVWQAMGNAFSSVVSVFDRDSDNLTINASPKTPESGKSFKVSWQESREGSYSFAYDCVEGLNFEILSPSGTKNFVFCNTPTTFISEDDSVNLIATIQEKDLVNVPIHIYFTESGSEETTATGEMTITIVKGGSDNNSGTGNNGDNTTDNTDNTDQSGDNTGGNTGSTGGNTGGAGGNTSNTGGNTGGTNTNTGGWVLVPNPNGIPALYGKADLSVKVLDTGYINRYNNQYTPSQNLSTDQKIGVRFEITNQGTNKASNWRWNATLPTSPNTTFYPSEVQMTLNPGDKIVYILAFDSIQQKQINQITINVDQDNMVMESNELNNSVIHSIFTYNLAYPYNNNNNGCYTSNGYTYCY